MNVLLVILAVLGCILYILAWKYLWKVTVDKTDLINEHYPVLNRPDGQGCGKPMGLSGHIHCYCGQIGVSLCKECKEANGT